MNSIQVLSEKNHQVFLCGYGLLRIKIIIIELLYGYKGIGITLHPPPKVQFFKKNDAKR